MKKISTKFNQLKKDVIFENIKSFLVLLLSAVFIGYFWDNYLIPGQVKTPYIFYGMGVAALSLVSLMLTLGLIYDGFHMIKNQKANKIIDNRIKQYSLALGILYIMFATLSGLTATTFPWYFNEIGIAGEAMFYRSISWTIAFIVAISLIVISFLIDLTINIRKKPYYENLQNDKLKMNALVFSAAGYLSIWLIALTGIGLWGITFNLETSSSWLLVDQTGPACLQWEQTDAIATVPIVNVNIGWTIDNFSLVGSWFSGQGMVNNWQSTMGLTYWIVVFITSISIYFIGQELSNKQNENIFRLSSIFLVFVFSVYFILIYVVSPVYNEAIGFNEGFNYVMSSDPTPSGFDPNVVESGVNNGGQWIDVDNSGTYTAGDTLRFEKDSMVKVAANYSISATFFGLAISSVVITYMILVTSILKDIKNNK